MFIVIISGSLQVEKITLNEKDAIGIWDTDQIEFECEEGTEFIIIIETPINQK